MSKIYIVSFSQLYHVPITMGVFLDYDNARKLAMKYVKNNKWDDNENFNNWTHGLCSVNITSYNILENPDDSKWYNLIGKF